MRQSASKIARTAPSKQTRDSIGRWQKLSRLICNEISSLLSVFLYRINFWGSLLSTFDALNKIFSTWKENHDTTHRVPSDANYSFKRQHKPDDDSTQLLTDLNCTLVHPSIPHSCHYQMCSLQNTNSTHYLQHAMVWQWTSLERFLLETRKAPICPLSIAICTR
jgi:hypothetical protein